MTCSFAKTKIVGAFLAFVLFVATPSVNAFKTSPRRNGAAVGLSKAVRLMLLEVTPGKTVFRAGEPIQLNLTVKNISGRTLILLDVTPESDFDIFVKDSSGTRLSLTERGRRLKAIGDNPLRREHIFLEPGRRIVFKVDIQQMFNLTRAGNYTALVGRDFYSRDGNSSYKVHSEVVRFRIIE